MIARDEPFGLTSWSVCGMVARRREDCSYRELSARKLGGLRDAQIIRVLSSRKFRKIFNRAVRTGVLNYVNW